VRDALAEHGGHEEDAIGDGFMITFPSSRDAVACAASIQRRVGDAGDGADGVRLRIGLAAARSSVRTGIRSARRSTAAARICARHTAARCSLRSRSASSPGPCRGWSSPTADRFELKGFPERWRLFEVRWDGLPHRRRTAFGAGWSRPSLRREAVAAAVLVAAVAMVAVLASGSGTRFKLARIDANAVARDRPAGGPG